MGRQSRQSIAICSQQSLHASFVLRIATDARRRNGGGGQEHKTERGHERWAVGGWSTSEDSPPHVHSVLLDMKVSVHYSYM